MCGIVGVISSKKKSKLCTVLFKELMHQSQIRGKHASGYTRIDKNGKLKTLSESIPIDKFLHKIRKSNVLLGHVRYSTSSLKYNQPIATGAISLVHNGIITQETPKNWDKYKLGKFKTENDSEILFKIIKNSKFADISGASIACGFINKTGLCAYRNEKRPLWLFKTPHIRGFASTKDIIERSFEELDIDGSKCKIIKTEPNRLFRISKNSFEEHELFLSGRPTKDQQAPTKIELKYVR